MISALVGLLARKAEVKYDSTVITSDQIASCIENMGFECEILGDGEENSEIEVVVSILLLPIVS